jgi:hypothetical protein
MAHPCFKGVAAPHYFDSRDGWLRRLSTSKKRHETPAQTIKPLTGTHRLNTINATIGSLC